MDAAYKVYASILNERLKKEVEDKLEEDQFGFRAGREAMGTVYIVNSIVNKEITKKKGKILVFFADLKAAFDRVDRTNLEERIEKIGVQD